MRNGCRVQPGAAGQRRKSPAGIRPDGRAACRYVPHRSFAEAGVDVGTTELAVQDLVVRPQTSGGLLMAVDPADADAGPLAELTPVVPSAQ